MEPDPILKELWEVKDKLAREAGYDAQRFLANLRQWESEHRHSEKKANTTKELPQLAAKMKRDSTESASWVLKDESAPKD